MKTSESIKNIAAALCKAQYEIKGAVKDSKNPFYKSSYADLQSVIAAIREANFQNGLSYTQPTSFIEIGEDKHQLVVNTRIMHISGEWIEGQYPIAPTKPDPQALGSAITYCRRYSLAAMFGVPQIDDDGSKATKDFISPNKNDNPPPKEFISDAQRTRLFAIAKSNGYSEADIKNYLKEYLSIESSKEITKDDYEAICNDFTEPNGNKQQPHGVV